MLKVNSISVFYGNVQVLWDVSFYAQEGEIISIVGANGAGKTTILRTVSGILNPKRGTVNFMGEDISNLATHEILNRGIVHIPEGRQLFTDMTVLENLEVGSCLKKAKNKRKEGLELVFEMFPRLAERQKQLAGTLSGGEQQMLAIARGLMALPKCIMFDEPSLGLAPNLVDFVFGVVKKISDENMTVILVEQNIKKALKISQRGYVLENGKVKMHNTGKELLNDETVKEAYLSL
jgi:branched-chain amino acid transport system ATP-binding protein